MHMKNIYMKKTDPSPVKKKRDIYKAGKHFLPKQVKS